MKVCPACGETYATFVDFCFADGEVLTVEAVAAPVAEPDGFDAPPPPKMLQGAQQGGGYTRSATPVPRARRPGRTLVQREGVYTPPAPDASYPPPSPTPTPADDRETDDVIAMEDGTPPAPVARAPKEPAPRAAPAARKEPEPVVTAFPSQDLIAPASSGGPPRPQPILPDAQPGQVPASARPGAAVVQPKPPKRQPKPVAQPVEPEAGRSAIGIVLAGFAVFVGIAIVGTLAVVAISALFASPADSDAVVLVAPVPDPVPVEPVPDPVPVEPVPVEPVPVEPDPVAPVPVAPIPNPVAPVPVAPVPVAPVPIVRPGPDGVAAVDPVQPRPGARLGAVRFDSLPRRATIILDGTPIGTTPFMKPDVRHGSRTVRLELEGYEPISTTFVLEGAELTVPRFTLTPVGGPAPSPEPTVPVPNPVVPDAQPVPFAEDTRPRRVTILRVDQELGTPCVVLETGYSGEIPLSTSLPPGTYTVECQTTDVTRATFSVETGWEPGMMHPVSINVR